MTNNATNTVILRPDIVISFTSSIKICNTNTLNSNINVYKKHSH